MRAGAGARGHWLSWHYRSQDESLIAFSNHHYYEGRLSSFPAPAAGGADAGGARWCGSTGTFHRSGPARCAADQPGRGGGGRRRDPPPVRRVARRAPSLGVVTFNSQQRASSRGCCGRPATSGSSRRWTARGDGLFVKNLENVQGDERDVILFSTAFCVNDRRACCR